MRGGGFDDTIDGVAIQSRDTVGGRYAVTKLLGHGNMGRVWEAVDQVLDRRVALKEVLLPHDAEKPQWEAEFARLQREARILARLDHPNAVSVHDVVRHRGAPVIVMQHVPLPSLRTCINGGTTWRAAGVARIGQLTLAALRHAHSRGVIHRDVKPDNVLYAQKQPVSLKVTDFGIARDVDTTTTSALIGTPAYLAPEQWEGEKATAQSDLWALGVMLFELAERLRPFDGPHPAAVMHAVFNREVPAMSRAAALEPAIRGLLVKDPRERMAVEDVERLLQVATDPPTTTPVPTRPVPASAGSTVPARPAAVPAAPETTRNDAGGGPEEGKQIEALGPLGVLTNFLATMFNAGVCVSMLVALTKHLPWDSAGYGDSRVVTRALGDDTVWPFTVAAALTIACACLSGFNWPARRSKSTAWRAAIAVAGLTASVGFAIGADRMTARLGGLTDVSATVDQVGDYLAISCMCAVLMSCILRCYATYAATAKE